MGVNKLRMRLSSITIDADGSPSGYIAWYNHAANISRIRVFRPSLKNGRYGVQRMDMLALYFALADNRRHIRHLAGGQKKKRLFVNIRSDSKTSVEQLQGISEIRESIMKRICSPIRKLLDRMAYTTVFNHLDRTRNTAGLLERRRRKAEKRRLTHHYEKTFMMLPLEKLL